MVGMAGVEPTTSASRTRRSTTLSYIPLYRSERRIVHATTSGARPRQTRFALSATGTGCLGARRAPRRLLRLALSKGLEPPSCPLEPGRSVR